MTPLDFSYDQSNIEESFQSHSASKPLSIITYYMHTKRKKRVHSKSHGLHIYMQYVWQILNQQFEIDVPYHSIRSFVNIFFQVYFSCHFLFCHLIYVPGTSFCFETGPSGVAMDFTFHGSQHVYGLPEHATSLALKNTMYQTTMIPDKYICIYIYIYLYIYQENDIKNTMSRMSRILPRSISNEFESPFFPVLDHALSELYLSPSPSIVSTVINCFHVLLGFSVHVVCLICLFESGFLDLFFISFWQTKNVHFVFFSAVVKVPSTRNPIVSTISMCLSLNSTNRCHFMAPSRFWCRIRASKALPCSGWMLPRLLWTFPCIVMYVKTNEYVFWRQWTHNKKSKHEHNTRGLWMLHETFVDISMYRHVRKNIMNVKSQQNKQHGNNRPLCTSPCIVMYVQRMNMWTLWNHNITKYTQVQRARS